MYNHETIRKAVEGLQENISKYRGMIASGEEVDVVISKGNKKIGDTMNVSLAPIITCENCSGCVHYCYDIKAVMAYKNVMRARAINTAVYMETPEKYFADIEKAIKARKSNKYFRWHVAGDIPSEEYFLHMVLIAKEHPDFRFWTYTKAYRIVNRFCKRYGKDFIPDNLSVMFSEWKGMPMDNPYGFPEFRVILKGEEKPEGVRWCCGNCNECIQRNSHCVKGETVYCMEH